MQTIRLAIDDDTYRMIISAINEDKGGAHPESVNAFILNAIADYITFNTNLDDDEGESL